MSAGRRFIELADEFRKQGSIMLVGHPHSNMKDEQCVEDFGSTPFILAQLWTMLVNVGLPPMSLPLHLLWWLYLVRNYPTKRVFSRVLHCVGVTYRKYLQPIKLAMMILQRTVVSLYQSNICTCSFFLWYCIYHVTSHNKLYFVLIITRFLIRIEL